MGGITLSWWWVAHCCDVKLFFPTANSNQQLHSDLNWHSSAENSGMWLIMCISCSLRSQNALRMSTNPLITTTSLSILSTSWPQPAVHQFSFDANLRPCCSLMHEAALLAALMTATLLDTAWGTWESNTLAIMSTPDCEPDTPPEAKLSG